MKAAEAKSQEADAYRVTKMLLRYAAKKRGMPAVLVEPKGESTRSSFGSSRPASSRCSTRPDSPAPRRGKLLAHGTAVLGVDLFGQGEFTPDGKPLAKARLLKSSGWERYLGYTLGYNAPLFAQRVHDVLSAIAYAKADVAAQAGSRWWACTAAGPGPRPPGRSPRARSIAP